MSAPVATPPAVPRVRAAAWSLERGARVLEHGVRFGVWAPNAERVLVKIFEPRRDGVRTREHALHSAGKGVFEGTIDGIGAGADYKYVLIGTNGRQEVPDPVSRWQPQGVHGPSRVVDPAAFHWTDSSWRGLTMADYAIYELHVGTFSDARNFGGVVDHLAELRHLGVTAIELMPVAEFPGARNWGYDGVHLYAPQSTYGGPDALRRLVNAAHEAGLAIILDVVYNHLGPEGNYLGSCGPYFADRYKTPWGPAVNYDGPDSDEVRRYVIDNALYWVTEYHFDGLRLDAVHGIFDFGARHVLRDLTNAVHEQAARLGREVVLIAESDLNDPRVIRDGAPYEWGFDAQWSDDLHHAIHAQLTGERSGYYADFGGIRPIARALEERFVYDGRYSAHRRRRHGEPATSESAERFVVCIQNHDQVGNRATGDRLSTLLSFEQRKLAAALYLLSPYVPMLWMGEEYGETRPFQYFVSHSDAELLEAVRQGRRKEFESFGWGADVPDPAAEETFRGSTLDRSLSGTPQHAELLTLYRDLLRVRKEERALRPGDAEVRVAYDETDGWITLELAHESSGDLLVLFNLSASARAIPAAATDKGEWRLRFCTDDIRYGGRGIAASHLRDDPRGESAITLPPLTAALYRRETR